MVSGELSKNCHDMSMIKKVSGRRGNDDDDKWATRTNISRNINKPQQQSALSYFEAVLRDMTPPSSVLSATNMNKFIRIIPEK